MKDRFDLIIFDWDGTLVDSTDWITHCLKKAASMQGFNIPDDQAARDTIGLSIQKAMTQLFPEIDQSTQDQMAASYSQEYFSKQLTAYDLFEGINEMLISLKQMGYQLAVATGKNRSGLDKALHGTGLNDFFHITRCADETASKPSPDMLEEIIEEMGISRERTVMIGDSVHDLKMATNADMASIAVSCGANSAKQLKVHSPLLILKQTTAILDIL